MAVGDARREQSTPVQPASHEHVRLSWHTPCCEQSFGQLGWLQSIPVQPALQTQRPHSSHLPRELQLRGQRRSHMGPTKPSSQ